MPTAPKKPARVSSRSVQIIVTPGSGNGRAQDKALTGFLDAAERAGRYDLARFLLAAAGQLLGPNAERGRV